MSDFVGILVTGGKALHLVDWNRPAWLDPDDPEGLRVVPDPQHFVVDALAVMCADGLAQCTPECKHSTDGLNELAGAQCEHVRDARERLYASFDKPLVFVHSDDQPDGLVMQDLARLQRAPHIFARLDKPLFDRNNWPRFS